MRIFVYKFDLCYMLRLMEESFGNFVYLSEKLETRKQCKIVRKTKEKIVILIDTDG